MTDGEQAVLVSLLRRAADDEHDLACDVDAVEVVVGRIGRFDAVAAEDDVRRRTFPRAERARAEIGVVLECDRLVRPAPVNVSVFGSVSSRPVVISNS